MSISLDFIRQIAALALVLLFLAACSGPQWKRVPVESTPYDSRADDVNRRIGR